MWRLISKCYTIFWDFRNPAFFMTQLHWMNTYLSHYRTVGKRLDKIWKSQKSCIYIFTSLTNSWTKKKNILFYTYLGSFLVQNLKVTTFKYLFLEINWCLQNIEVDKQSKKLSTTLFYMKFSSLCILGTRQFKID